MIFKSIYEWDEELWEQARTIYEEAFGREGGKNSSIIKNMTEKQLAQLHFVLLVKGETKIVIGVAITAVLLPLNALLIDYLAIAKQHRRNKFGFEFVKYLTDWAIKESQCERIVIEVEAYKTPIYRKRIQFWEECGFTLDSYVHQYKVVPEPYQAMYKMLTHHTTIQINGQVLFHHMAEFHRRCFKGSHKL